MTINTSPYLWILFIVQMIVIYFISRITINKLFEFIRFFIHEDKIVFSLISLIFLPGTLIHESAHFLTAIVLMLRVRSMNIFPQFSGNYIKLGSVEYERQDALRGILVGVAPIFMGIGLFFAISYFKLFPGQNIWWNILIAYLIFTVSSTMFSSQKDLQDLAIVIPLIVIIAGIFYVFNINLRLDIIWENRDLINSINLYLFFSMVIHISLIIFLKWINSLLNR